MISYNMILYLLLVIICSSSMNLVSGVPKTRCVDHDRIALLQFKKALVDDYALLESWNDTTNARDCCQWRGVGCNNATGQVITLDLNNVIWIEGDGMQGRLSGEIDSSLLSLSSLTYLDLSGNIFTRIPKFIGSLKNLQHLKFSYAELTSSTDFPDHIGNLSNLQTLDLKFTPVVFKNTHSLSSLSSLKYLNLSYIDLSKSDGLLYNAIKMPSLVELQLSDCKLPNDTANTFLGPLTNLSNSFSVLDISSNDLPSSIIYPWLFNFSGSLMNINLINNKLLGTIPDAFGTFTNLETLDMTSTGLKGGIPSSFRNLSRLRQVYLQQNNLDQDLPGLFNNLPVRSLEVLDLSGNRLSGSLPDFTTFSALTKLHLARNRLNGSFPRKFQGNSHLLFLDLADNHINGLLPDLSVFGSLTELYFERNLLQGTLAKRLGSLSTLESLGASSNFFQGTITEQHVANLSRLIYLDLSYNSLALNLSPDRSPPFQLYTILLSSCKLGCSFPTWLKTQNNLFMLDISNSGINGIVPNWFWESLVPHLRYLNLSSNHIYGTVPHLVSGKLNYIDLSLNSFSGNLPLFPISTFTLILNDNMFSGSLSSLCNPSQLLHLDLSNNKLSGKLPNCWNNYERLTVLNLENNKFTGAIPSSIEALRSVGMMTMRGNELTGEIPSSLRNCTELELLDLGENKLSGKIPEWTGDSFSNLRILSLPSNRFHGEIPTSLCNLKKIKILDLSGNNISGNIPKCVNNFFGMTEGSLDASIRDHIPYSFSLLRTTISPSYVLKAILEWKGRRSVYRNTLGLVVSLDLSSNRLSGEIPNEITSLSALIAVNLSRNNLTGLIPQDVGLLRWLDFLDLSRNHLVGRVPLSLSRVSNLGVLDLSFNNLSGRIPKSTQLQSFNMSSYTGNPALCGDPLLNRCPGDDDGQSGGRQEDVAKEADDDGKLIYGFYVSIVVGFVFGFWGFCGSLLVSDSWRYGYFKFLKMMKDKTLVTVEISYYRIRRRIPTYLWK
ncbi:hypothetical protein SSX86_023675 [Deinandra increscens subsp. villosa]|uniref:Leucine-rich repeat-containing N-terminal plant-type domain-containing protein n=1 Tax=Deinandra increscens subsp. villosa TaxID=3103831 RepID=A0AAP0CRB9_9ASTR